MQSKRKLNTVRIRAVQENRREDVSDEMSVSRDDITRLHNVTSDNYHHGFEVEMDQEEYKGNKEKKVLKEVHDVKKVIKA